MNLLPGKSTLLCSLLFAFSLAFTATTFADDVVGTYKCEGGSGDTKYSGTVTIAKKGDAYQVTWKLGGDENYKGIGVLQGDVLAVSYYGSMSGVVAYKVEGDKLTGKWTMVKGDGTVSTETLTK